MAARFKRHVRAGFEDYTIACSNGDALTAPVKMVA